MQATQSLLQAKERVEQLLAQKTLIDGEIVTRQAQRADVQRDIAGIQARLDQLPVREQEMAGVMRDYQISKANYQSLLDKKLAAEMAGDMERRQKSEHFSMLEPARTPEKPAQPDRLLLSIVAVFLSLVLAACFAIFREMRVGVLLGEWELPQGLLVVARLPVIPDVVAPPSRRRPAALVTAGMLSLLAIAGTVYFVMGRS
jgi:polysaccharide biosynthesis transport protein